MITKMRQVVLPITLILIFLLTACSAPGQTSGPKEAPEKIIIGNPIALSGPNAPAAALSQVPSYDLWVDDVNAAGGIYVKEFDKKIPVEILRYDDTSDVGTAVQLTEKLIVEDKVNFLLPPWGTASNFYQCSSLC